MHKGIRAANFTLVVVQNVRVKRSSLTHILHKLTCPKAAHLASCTLCFFFLLNPSGSLLQAFWLVRTRLTIPPGSFTTALSPLVISFSVYHLPSTSLIQVGKGGKRQNFYHDFSLLHNLFPKSFCSGQKKYPETPCCLKPSRFLKSRKKYITDTHITFRLGSTGGHLPDHSIPLNLPAV